jgi:methyltransferase (TIGR00027 family)
MGAVRPGHPSTTAQNIALARAWLTRAGIVDDRLAHSYLDRRHSRLERALWLGRWSRLGRRPFAYIAARTRFYDALVGEALDHGITQVVLLAAGYDTRAWRLARPGLRFFEVDHPDTQARKRSLSPSGGPCYAPADLASVPLGEALAGAGFAAGRATVFCCEGLTMYLAEEDARRLLASAAALAAEGSRLGVDFAVEPAVTTPRQRVLRAATRAHARSSGEHLRFALDPADAPALLADTGWHVDRTLTGPKLHEQFLAPHELPVRWTWGASFVVAATVRAVDRESSTRTGR